VPRNARFILYLSLVACVLAVACGAPPSVSVPRPAPETSSTVTEKPPAKSDPYPDDVAIAKAGQEYLDLLVEIRPEDATALGLHKNDDKLDDRTIAGHDKNTDREEALLKSFEERFRTPRASGSAKTDLALLLGALRTDIRRKRVQRPLQRQPDVYVDPLNAIFQMTAREYAPAPERARNVLARLLLIPGVVETAKQNLLNPPRVWTEVAIDRAGSAKTRSAASIPRRGAARGDHEDRRGAQRRHRGVRGLPQVPSEGGDPPLEWPLLSGTRALRVPPEERLLPR
jgi:hypothetical protein